MSEVQSRPARGRASKRGGFAQRGGRSRGAAETAQDPDTYEEDSELSNLRKQYSGQLGTLKEMFPNWTDEDIIYALQETDGNLEATIERITEGHTSQWGEVKKKAKDRSRSKVKDSAAPADAQAPTTRSGRGRGNQDATRGGRGRGSDRGRARGRGGQSTNGTPHSTTKKEEWGAQSSSLAESDRANGWSDVTKAEAGEAKGWGDEETPAEKQAQAAASAPAAASGPPKKTWASMFAKPVVPQVVKKVLPDSVTEKIEHVVEKHAEKHAEKEPEAKKTEEAPLPVSAPEESLPPPKDELTEDNLEKLPDESGPLITETQASNAATSGVGAHSIGTQSVGSGTVPQPANAQSARIPSSGYAATASRAATQGRSSSFQRKVWDQQEAVVMPGNHAVDRTAVQFGSLGLNGSGEDIDIDDDREEAETREQPPQHSPVAHPITSLPPAPQKQVAEDNSAAAAPGRSSTGLPAPAAPTQPQASGTTPIGAPSLPHQTSQDHFSQFGRNQSQPEQAAPAAKPYEPFGQTSHQPAQNHPYGGYHSQQIQQALGGSYSSAPSELSSYYSADSRLGMQYYGGPYGHQGSQPQDSASQSRTAGPLGTSPGESNSAPAQRYGQSEAQGSGHSTPNPTSAQQNPQSHLPHHPQSQGIGQYGYPNYFQNPYYAAYLAGQFPGYGPNYQSQYGGKHNMYGQPHQYGISPQGGFDHSSSPANSGAYGQPGARENASSDYSRPGQAPHGSTPSGYGQSDVLGRGIQGQGQGQGYGQQNGEDIKGYDAKSGAGAGQTLNRPGSAATPSSSSATQAQGIPQSQQQQSGASSYGGFSHGSYTPQGGAAQSGHGSQQGFGGQTPGQGQQSGQQSHNSGTGGYGGYSNSFGSGFYGSNSGNQRNWNAYGH